MKKPLQFTNAGNDLQGNPILEINGEHYLYVDGERGESNGADHIWRAKSGNQLAYQSDVRAARACVVGCALFGEARSSLGAGVGIPIIGGMPSPWRLAAVLISV
jgi:hypothetical protein